MSIGVVGRGFGDEGGTYGRKGSIYVEYRTVDVIGKEEGVSLDNVVDTDWINDVRKIDVTSTMMIEH